MSVTFAYSGTVLNFTGYQSTINHRQQAKSNEATTGTECSNVLATVSKVCSMTPGHCGYFNSKVCGAGDDGDITAHQCSSCTLVTTLLYILIITFYSSLYYTLDFITCNSTTDCEALCKLKYSYYYYLSQIKCMFQTRSML